MNSQLLYQIFEDRGEVPKGTLLKDVFSFYRNNLNFIYELDHFEIHCRTITGRPIFKTIFCIVKEEPLVDLILNMEYKQENQNYSDELRRIMVERATNQIKEHFPNSDTLYDYYSNRIRINSITEVSPYLAMDDNWKALDQLLTYLKIASS